ncbi:MAG: DUF2779 domain-containing protein [Gemmatimonadaceae bacterium]
MAGKQCHKLLWWKVHEPLAEELQPDKVLQDLFDQGAQVGALARDRFPGGVLIDLPHNDYAGKIEATRRAIASGAPAIFEASFSADDVFVAVDVLVREGNAWRLIEVKSSTSAKEEHLLDAAIQLHVLQRCGLAVHAVEIMHLNKEFRHPEQGDLFAREDVTGQVTPLLPGIPAEIEAQVAMLAGGLPEVAFGQHCHEPRECPFMERCWPSDADHIRNLYNVGKVACHKYMTAGVHSIWDIPPKKKLPPAAQRQLRAMREKRIIVEDTLADALAPFSGRLGYLDFETIARAVPVWPEMNPWMQAAAQFSYHESRPDGSYTHAEWLAEGPKDARPLLAQAMIAATRNAERVVSYSAFEKTKIRDLQVAVPELRDELVVLEAKLIDLLPVLRDNVYHAGFRGSFSLKYVLTPLVPELTYKDMVIVDGLTASVEIARLLFVADRIPAHERDRVRQDLLAYCKQDTWAMVRLLEEMRELAGIPPQGFTPLRIVR